MTFDTFVFDPELAPCSTYDDFIEWYDLEVEREPDGKGFPDSLVKWKNAMQEEISDTEAPDDFDEPVYGYDDEDGEDVSVYADYALHSCSIMAFFSPGYEEKAERLARKYAKEFGLAYFDVLGDSGITFPDGRTLTKSK
ncbi:hypothetical protein [Corynebacterium cystitidis]|uniref:hypothetical protein n=1 Tax=Corynebacterium cystitidis TaxID=35757 RepID=UPI00211E9673|nr:hypothetical protein [Corynebacterium cystitidis]